MAITIYTSKEVCEMLHISITHLRRLIRKKKIIAYKESATGGFRIREEALWDYINRKEDDMDTEITGIQLEMDFEEDDIVGEVGADE